MFGLGKSALDKGLDAFALRDWRRARKHLAAADRERPTAMGDYHLGLLHWRGLGGARDVVAGARHFERAANAGHVAAQTAFGMALRTGVGVAKNDEEARRMFRAAAAGDDMDAVLQMATLTESEEAQRWLERAAEMGHPGAMLVLSDLLVRDAPVEALAWLYASAALSGDDEARQRAASMARELNADDVESAQRMGRSHVKRQARTAAQR